MQPVKVSKYTQNQAKEYADTEAEIHGFPVGGARWQTAFKKYLSESFSSMAVGRNPRVNSHQYRAFIVKYPEIFGEEGFAGKVAKNYISSSGEKGIPLVEVQNRIMSTVMNVVKIFENGIMNVKTTTKGRKQGKISSEEMSDFQMPNREDFKSDDEFKAAKKDVVYNWLQRDILVDAFLELLMPFFKLDEPSVERIMSKITIEDDGGKETAIGENRILLIDTLRKIVKPQVDQISYVDMLLKK